MSDEVRTVVEGIGWLLGGVAGGAITYLTSQRSTRQRINAISANVDSKYQDMLERNVALSKRLDEEAELRQQAETRIREMVEERTRIDAKHADDMATVTLDVQRLTDKVASLERERDQLRLERDEARQAQQTLTAKLEAATDHIAKIENKFAQMAAENKAFDLIFSRLDFQLVSTNQKRTSRVQQ